MEYFIKKPEMWVSALSVLLTEQDLSEGVRGLKTNLCPIRFFACCMVWRFCTSLLLYDTVLYRTVLNLRPVGKKLYENNELTSLTMWILNYINKIINQLCYFLLNEHNIIWNISMLSYFALYFYAFKLIADRKWKANVENGCNEW